MNEKQNEIKHASKKYIVFLNYSCDFLSDKARDEKITRLLKGGDGLTKVLKHFNIDFYVTLMSDFWIGEPCLESIDEINAQGNFTRIFGDNCLYHPSGEHYILYALKQLNVIPCSIEETYKIRGRC